ncbi:glycosyltransferase [Bisgaard Taxon 10/6]|uniref:glycosyltransferase n=1 Tax=Exercitatus varius TaxID=67857 RepID=UPI00294B3966|nr:glycosyltransferase [Exercitatus varius]MDG2947544.1 glycosyltransferase [Exercitatus varius]
MEITKEEIFDINLLKSQTLDNEGNNQPTVLILTSFLKSYSGSEIVTLDLAKTFKHLGFKVSVASFVVGSPLQEKFQQIGITLQNIHTLSLDEHYDIIWSQHFTTLPYCLHEKHISADKIIFSSLSSFESIEQPPIIANQISLFIANSLEIKNNLIKNYEIPEDYIKILPNPVNEDFFKYQKELSEQLQKIAIVSNHIPFELLDAVSILETVGITVDIYGQGFKHELITPEILIGYDAIITIGKTVQYGLALGIPVYLYDIYGGEGWLHKGNIQLASDYNFSGRSISLKKSSSQIVKEILTYSKEQFDFYINFARQRYSMLDYIKDIVSQPYSALDISSKTLELLSMTQQSYYCYTQSGNDFSQLFFSKDEQFSEKLSFKTTIIMNSMNTISFIPPNKEYTHFRLDLTNKIALISQLRIELFVNGVTKVFDLSCAKFDDLFSFSKHNYLSYTSDSKIYFNLENGVDRINIFFHIDDNKKTSALFSYLKNAYSTSLEKLEFSNTHIQELTEELQKVQLHAYNIEKLLNTANQTLNTIQNSTSWKATYPIRCILDFIKTIFQKAKNLHRKIQNFGGYNLVFRKFRNKVNELGLKKALQFAFVKSKTILLMVDAGESPITDQISDFDINNRIAYQKWIKLNDTLGETDISHIKQEIQQLHKLPKISVLMPVYNVDIKWLKEAIESVQNQLYPNWELCISDDNSSNKDIKRVLQQYVALDPRIKVVFRKKNGHISENSNSALELVTGEWVALMDHDDLLPIHALYEVAKAINSYPSATLIYSDEDKIDEHNKRFMPHFKADFNLDLLYGQNYISHLGVYRTDIAKQIHGFRKGLEGSQDYDFLLRYLLVSGTENVVHIPKILYHWRAIEGSTALAAGEKSYTTEAGIKALKNYFSELKQDVEVTQGKAANLYRVKWNLKDEPLVSLIIPTYNGYTVTKQAIDSILTKTSYKNYEIILVDNNSNDPESLAYFKQIAKHPKITVLRYPYPFNYSAINNFAIKKARGKVIGLINNDIEVINKEWLTEMVSQAMRPEIGCVGAMLYYPNDQIQHAGVIIGIGGVAGHSHKYYPRNHHGYFSRLYLVQNYSAVTAACLLIKKSIFDEVGGLNEKDLTVAFNDVDFCLKVQKAGYRNLWTPYAELYHHESISRGHEDNPEKVARFNKEVDYMLSTWNTRESGDRYYNPNLTYRYENFDIAMEPRI